MYDQPEVELLIGNFDREDVITMQMCVDGPIGTYETSWIALSIANFKIIIHNKNVTGKKMKKLVFVEVEAD